eukprot:CAMPEP_0177267904 /NCGR_PEP_ID=MMETSP0367-20130122/63511_1 /TAXON_ID=447022 ORGANISM="Scrippsiella hangoei-like, Strain SHHI-4" /NCGR_SAMPLE_ID=MMETSP0367 /ASSEMBLY_ACC=CAM_ASM_000362 /LENGTH=55 /DNA_ID=CAMNT_0018723461 /DNA_START=269 /DNA_END=436 /DNA_ORIENTATION=-
MSAMRVIIPLHPLLPSYIGLHASPGTSIKTRKMRGSRSPSGRPKHFDIEALRINL